MSIVLKAELDRLIRSVQSGIEYQSDPVNMPKIGPKTGQNQELEANPNFPLVQFLKP